MKKLVIIGMLLGGIFARNSIDVGSHGEWSFNQSTLQAFYMLEAITIDGVDPDAEGADIVGAFFNDVCVGFYPAGAAYTTVPLMGNDGPSTSDYMSAGDVAELRYYDASNDAILELSPGNFIFPIFFSN